MTDLIDKRPNFYGFGGLDRSAHVREREGWLDELLERPDTVLVPVWRTRSFVLEVESAAPRAATLSVAEHRHLVARAEFVAFLGEHQGVAHVALDLSPLEETDLLNIL